MKRTTILTCLAVFIALPCLAGTTITYSYDKQHRLTQVSYSDSEKMTYSYDGANNLDLYVVITDSKYFKSFLLYLARRSFSEDGYFSLLEEMLPAAKSLLKPWENWLVRMVQEQS